MLEGLLPVGSVVRLRGGEKLVMIAGFYQATKIPDSPVFDYAGLPYPVGYLDADQMLLFDQGQIEEVFFTGFLNDEGKEFMARIEKLADEVKKR